MQIWHRVSMQNIKTAELRSVRYQNKNFLVYRRWPLITPQRGFIPWKERKPVNRSVPFITYVTADYLN
jgi:hypothetical protein